MFPPRIFVSLCGSFNSRIVSIPTRASSSGANEANSILSGASSRTAISRYFKLPIPEVST